MATLHAIQLYWWPLNYFHLKDISEFLINCRDFFILFDFTGWSRDIICCHKKWDERWDNVWLGEMLSGHTAASPGYERTGACFNQIAGSEVMMSKPWYFLLPLLYLILEFFVLLDWCKRVRRKIWVRVNGNWCGYTLTAWLQGWVEL